MEWEKLQPPPPPTDELGSGGMFVKVMTDEQMEVLRKQIAVYATICDQLVDLHKSIASQHDLSGARLGNLYCDPSLVSPGGHKLAGRQRWTPTPVQLQTLERIFEQGNGTPTKQKIKEIADELSRHGQISETNVYNWFQNRRARSKRKQQVTVTNNVESEVEAEVESPPQDDDKNTTKPDDFQPSLIPTSDACYHNSEVSSAVHSVSSKSDKVESTFASESTPKPAGSFDQMSFYGLSNPRMEQFIGKMEVYENYNPYLQEDDYNITG
ncbi:unnamed protein product [Cuscuta epithymum]|uniref:Homeobox domain-containing protein n=1 Tax=Cuscuta epithymum TaxID=186058 RepID=A0AAV0FUJ6_9ASTE|nr:unnamed protein product [Cuscuta epithymum]CAH9139359.1 unnamed protein product [Cuscuta epithymum]